GFERFNGAVDYRIVNRDDLASGLHGEWDPDLIFGNNARESFGGRGFAHAGRAVEKNGGAGIEGHSELREQLVVEDQMGKGAFNVARAHFDVSHTLPAH